MNGIIISKPYSCNLRNRLKLSVVPSKLLREPQNVIKQTWLSIEEEHATVKSAYVHHKFPGLIHMMICSSDALPACLFYLNIRWCMALPGGRGPRGPRLTYFSDCPRARAPPSSRCKDVGDV